MNKDEGAYKLNRIFDQLIKNGNPVRRMMSHGKLLPIRLHSASMSEQDLGERSKYLKYFHIGSVIETLFPVSTLLNCMPGLIEVFCSIHWQSYVMHLQFYIHLFSLSHLKLLQNSIPCMHHAHIISIKCGYRIDIPEHRGQHPSFGTRGLRHLTVGQGFLSHRTLPSWNVVVQIVTCQMRFWGLTYMSKVDISSFCDMKLSH